MGNKIIHHNCAITKHSLKNFPSRIDIKSLCKMVYLSKLD